MRLTVGPGADIARIVRAARGESIVLVVSPMTDPLERALARAAIAPLAIACAPATRLNAVFVAEGAASQDVEAAVTFLDIALSTTGQILDIA